MHLISTNFENLINLTYNTVYVTRYSKLLICTNYWTNFTFYLYILHKNL